MNNSIEQALETILKTARASDQFQIRTRELHHITKAQVAKALERDLSNVEAEARLWLNTVDLGEAAGQLDPPYRFFLRSNAVEGVHMRRWGDGLYDSALGEISACIDAIREREGLNEDEDWRIGQGPEDREELSKRYSQVLDAKFEETLREYGLVDMADLCSQDRKAYDELREEGRRLVFEYTSELEQVRAVQKQFEDEAEICAESGAYHAATVMIGSAIESAFLFTCLKHRDEALNARDCLPKRKRPRSEDPKSWGFSDFVLVVDKAGWLSDFHFEDGTLITRGLGDMARNLRNLVHPSRHLTKQNLDIALMYGNARAAYILLKQRLPGHSTEDE